MPGEITVWLQRLEDGDASALDHVMRLLYDELRQLARHRLSSERSGHTLGATALVNEAYLRLARQDHLEAGNRTRFFAIASRTMRRVLVDHARARKRLKRGGLQEAVPLDDVEPFLKEDEAAEVLALEEALNDLATINERAATVVEHRFFSGLSVEEIAEVLGVSAKTVQRDWITARAWLRKEIAGSLPSGPGPAGDPSSGSGPV